LILCAHNLVQPPLGLQHESILYWNFFLHPLPLFPPPSSPLPLFHPPSPSSTLPLPLHPLPLFLPPSSPPSPLPPSLITPSPLPPSLFTPFPSSLDLPLCSQHVCSSKPAWLWTQSWWQSWSSKWQQSREPRNGNTVWYLLLFVTSYSYLLMVLNCVDNNPYHSVCTPLLTFLTDRL